MEENAASVAENTDDTQNSDQNQDHDHDTEETVVSSSDKNSDPEDKYESNSNEESESYEGVSNDNEPKGKESLASKVRKVSGSKNAVDLIDGRYAINLDMPLNEYNSEFAKAYEVTDKRDKKSTSLYALVYGRSMSPRVNIIKTLKNISLNNFLTPIAADVILLSKQKEHCFTVVLPKPQGMKLSEYVLANGAFSEERIIKKIIEPLSFVLDILEKAEVVHGRINLNNIYIDDAKNIILGECISEPTGYSQSSFYETLERIRILPIGKGRGDVSIDYYALGAVSLCLQKGRDISESIDDEQLVVSKLMQGSFNTLVQNLVLSSMMMDLYRGLLNDKASARWRSSSLKDWLKGKHFNLVRMPPIIEATRSIFFCDVQYFNRSALAHALHHNWSAAKIFLREDKLIKWIEGSVGNSEMADKLRQAQKITSSSEIKNSVFDSGDELVVRCLSIIEPGEILRIKTLAINADALGSIIADEFRRKSTSYLQLIATALRKDLIQQNIASAEGLDKRIIVTVEKLTNLIQLTGVGFGIERCLYELNPILPCQSEATKSEHILKLDHMLEFLDARASETGKYPMDRHIAAFIASRINLQDGLFVSSLMNFPKLQENKHIQTLTLLSTAQRSSSVRKLKGVAGVIGEQLLSVADCIHSKKIKEEYSKNIKGLSRSGSLAGLYSFISESQLLAKDHTGFEEAKRQYKQFSVQFAKLKKEKTIANLGYHYGLRVAMFLSYALCALVLFILIVK